MVRAIFRALDEKKCGVREGLLLQQVAREQLMALG